MIRLVLLSLLVAAPAPVEKASLRLTSLPGVEVAWEGVALGETGDDGVLWIRDIPPGDYTLTLSKPGYRPRTSRLTLAGGETTVSLGLERVPPPPAAPRPRSVKPPAAPPRESPGEDAVAGGESPEEAVAVEDESTREAAAADGAAEPELAEPEAAAGAAPGVGSTPELQARQPAAMAAAPEEPVSAPETEGREPAAGGAGRLALPAALALTAALFLLFALAARRRAAARRRKPSRGRPRTEPSPAAPPAAGAVPADEPPGFLKDLQRREEFVDSGVPEIIEVTDVEILDEEP